MELRSYLSDLILAATLCATLAIVARSRFPQHPWLFYVFKPLTTCLILGVAFIASGGQWFAYSAAIVVGLLFSLAGDILLILPADLFLAGLASFLLAQVSYGFAFAAAARYVSFPWITAPVVLVGALTLRYLWPGLTFRLRLPVLAYVVVIVAMASLAIYRASTLQSPGALAAAVGAVLFMSSDALLAVNRFRHPFAAAQAVVLGTYFAGQLLIALSVGI